MNLSSIDNENSILPPEALNGRVNIIDKPPNVLFDMKEKVAVRNKASEYREPLTGIIEDTMLSKVFFCAENVQIIQNGIRGQVFLYSLFSKRRRSGSRI